VTAATPFPEKQAVAVAVASMQYIPGQRGEVRSGGDVPLPRVVVDERTGAQWLVGEREASHQPGARADRYLCFDSADTRRRVWHYPSEWRRLSDADLLDLGERAP
jgi:hypothetical protein